MTTMEINPAAVEELAGKLFGYMGGMIVSAGIYLGDQLGLFRAMAGAGSLTSEQLAERTNLNERWVREWLSQQAAAGLVAYEGGTFRLSDEGALVLADESTPASMIGFFGFVPALIPVLEGLPECFQTGVGRKYDAHGRIMAAAMQRATAASNGVFLDSALPALDGVITKLENGAKVADIGCGAGGRLIAAAERYPRSEFHGYDISEVALGLAREAIAKASVPNLTLHNPDTDPLPADGSFDLVWFGDVVHDLARPDAIFGAVRKAMNADGTMLVIDIAAGETLEENIQNPIAPMMFGMSQLICMSSGLSEPGGAGIGTLGLSPSRLQSLAQGAGFTRFRRTDVVDPINAYYEIRP